MAKKKPRKKPVGDELPKRLVRERDALRKLLDDKMSAFRALAAEGAKTFDRQWEIIGDILEHDPPLWRGRYASEVKFVATELEGIDRRDVRRNVLVAGAFRPEDIENTPISVLEEIAHYVKEKSGMEERPRAIDLSRVRIEVPNGRGARRVFGDRATLEDVRAARKALGRKAKKWDGPRAKHVRAAIGRRISLAKLEVALTEEHASFRRVPLERLPALGEVLARLEIPKPKS